MKDPGQKIEELQVPWSVLHVVANHEKRVAQQLAARSIEHYLPVYAERSQWSDRIVQLERPLFRGYVFARFATSARTWVLSVPGVLHLLGGGRYGTVSAVGLDRIRAGLAGGLVLRPHEGIVAGGRVRVNSGIFKGAEGFVEKFCGQCKVVMALDATGQRYSVEIGLNNIEIVSEVLQLEEHHPYV